MSKYTSQSEMDRRGIAHPNKLCPKCGKPGPIVFETKVCIACGAKAHNVFKRLTMKDK